MRIVNLLNLSNPSSAPIRAPYCHSFWSKFKGLMFRASLSEQEGLLLVEKSASVVNASIHMFFMNFDIAAIWLDEHLVVVDKCIARRWKPMYKPSRPAQYILEAHPSRINDYSINDRIQLEDA